MDSKQKILAGSFRQAVAIASTDLYRDMPWRQPVNGLFNPYTILLSEMMLQQTQVGRVMQKFNMFMAAYPGIHDIAEASLSDVLRLWSGLGYNRRAKYLHDACKQLQLKVTWSYDDLVVCKGIGPNTAKAILVYAYNRPEVFIETNIRTVVLYYFFKDEQKPVTDAQILAKIEQNIDTKNPRKWYWALMDLGTYLKQSDNALLQKAHAYKKQPAFEGSARQVRGNVLKLLGASEAVSAQKLHASVQDTRLDAVLAQLQQEGLITHKNGTYYLGTRL